MFTWYLGVTTKATRREAEGAESVTSPDTSLSQRSGFTLPAVADLERRDVDKPLDDSEMKNHEMKTIFWEETRDKWRR